MSWTLVKYESLNTEDGLLANKLMTDQLDRYFFDKHDL